MVGAFLGAARPVELEGERLTLAFAPDATFGKKKCEDNRALLQTALRALTGTHVQIDCECREVEDDGGARLSPFPMTSWSSGSRSSSAPRRSSTTESRARACRSSPT